MVMRVAFISSYPPRECGIATYTRDLLNAIFSFYLETPTVVAVNEDDVSYDYGGEVEFQIQRELTESYIEAAEYINESDIDVVNLQHEFGLYGGRHGERVLSLLKRLEKPTITTLHTLLLEPEPEASRVMERILRHSDNVVVLARAGIRILERLYGVPTHKVHYIPHGCPDVPFISGEKMKSHLGLKDRIVLSTFGLLSRGKGIEYAIQALPPIVKYEPRILYFIIGKTHPEVVKHEGEAYRKELIDLVYSLGLERNVGFVNHFLGENELIRYLQATDIYITPYPNKEQISSGTLTYALGAGKAIITTPFLHAQEALSQECAMRCEFKNSASITRRIKKLIKNVRMRRTLEKRAYNYSRGMTWPNVAIKYIRLFHEALRSRPHKKLTPLQITEV